MQRPRSRVFEPSQRLFALKSPHGNATHQGVRSKVRSVAELKETVLQAKGKGKKIVFTNGCFDLLHRGHVHLLREARKLGDVLIVAINADDSIRQLKGDRRPVLALQERAELLAALEMVDYVTSFEESDPSRVIQELQPDVLVKGGDWSKDQVVGWELVEENGGRVEVIPYLEGHSTTQIIERIRGN